MMARMSNAFTDNVSRSAVVNATRVPFAKAGDLHARLGTELPAPPRIRQSPAEWARRKRLRAQRKRR